MIGRRGCFAADCLTACTRIEATPTCPTMSDAGAPRRRDDVAPLLDRRRDRLFHQDMDAARDGSQCDLMMEMRRSGDGERLAPRFNNASEDR